jgi:two-component sensor histidine kinase
MSVLLTGEGDRPSRGSTLSQYSRGARRALGELAETQEANLQRDPPEMQRRVALTPRRVFILLGLIAAVAIVAFRTQSLVSEREHVLQQRRAQAATLAQFAATYSARLYDQSSRASREIARRVGSGPMSDAELHNLLTSRVSDTSIDSYFVVLDPSGRVRATSQAGATSSINFGAPNFAEHWAGVEHEIIPVLRSRLTGAIIYSYSERLQDRFGRFAGVVGVNVRPEGIRPTAQRKPTDPLLSVWDKNGRFIAASFVDFDASGRAIAPAIPHGLAIPGSPRSPDFATLSRSAPVPGWPLIAVASYDQEGVLSGWRQDIEETIILVLLTIVTIAGLVWLGVKTADRETAARAAFQASTAVAEAALRDRDLLLKEVHHRVKNSLMMTSSLLHLQERRFNDPDVRDAFESTRRRLSSIGLVHEALYSGSSMQDVDLGDYLNRLLEELEDGYGASARGITIVRDIEPIQLAAEQATPVGLIVAEVVTNAFKHAFSEQAAGQITVQARRDGFADVEVMIRDNGEGYGEAPEERPSGLGSRLIDSLTQQLHGAVSKADDGGAVFRLTFPKATR